MTSPHDKHPAPKPAVGDRQDRGAEVQAMFASIAPRYDLLNRVLSLGVDTFWRRAAAQEALARHPRRVLDVATGTGDFALELKTRAPQVEVVGSDFVPEMLSLAGEKARARHLEIRFEEGDALNLPYPDGSFDTVTCSFGFRNFADYARGLSEFYRVLAPGGRLVLLEFPPPGRGLFGLVFRFYFQQVLPRIGALVSGNGGAYTYLPESVLAFPEPERLAQIMRATGFRTRYRPLTFGIAGLWVGDRK